MEVSVPGGGNIYLGIGNWLPISYLEQQDTKDLADLYLCAARRNWSHHGNVSLRAYHDHSQHGGVRAWPSLCERRKNQSTSVERVVLNALANQVGIVFGEADPPIYPEAWLSYP